MTRVSFVNNGEHLQFNHLTMGMQFASTFVNLVDYSKCPEIHYLIVNPENFMSTKPFKNAESQKKKTYCMVQKVYKSRNRYVHS